jgi:hypothetical protein
LVGKIKVKDQFEQLDVDRDNIEIDMKKIIETCGGIWAGLGEGLVENYCELRNKPSGSMNCGNCTTI